VELNQSVETAKPVERQRVPIVVRSNSVPILVEAIPFQTKRSISVGPVEMETLPLITEVKILSSPPAGSNVSMAQKVQKSDRRRSSTFWKDSSVKHKPPPQQSGQHSSRDETNIVKIGSRSEPSPPPSYVATVASSEEETRKEEDAKASSKVHRKPLRSSSTTGIRRQNNEVHDNLIRTAYFFNLLCDDSRNERRDSEKKAHCVLKIVHIVLLQPMTYLLLKLRHH